jgi:membrane associated rhomboid family serine protease
MGTVENIISDKDAWIFYAFILLIAILGVRDLISPKFPRVPAKAAPSLMVSVGVLGTFWGIFRGLQSFDVANIEQSVPELLNGLKVAFGTSIIGMIVGLLFTVIRDNFPRKTTPTEATPQAILAELRNISKSRLQTQS